MPARMFDGDGSQRINRKRALGGLVVTALLAAGVWAAIGQAASFSHLSADLHRAQPAWFALCLAGVVVSYLGYALLYRSVAAVEDGPRPRLTTSVRVGIGAFAASVVVTAVGRLGVEYWSLRRMRQAPAQAWSRVLALNVAEWALLAALAWAGALALLAGAARAPLSLELAWAIVPPLCAAPAAWLSGRGRRALGEDRGGRFRRTFAAVVRALVLVRRLASGAPERRAALAGGLLYWGGEIVTTWAALRAFGISLGPAALIVAYATGYASTSLPLPAGGAGGVDAATTYALTLVGVPLGPALLGAVVQRLFTYWLLLLPALFSVRSLRRLGDDLAAQAPESPRAPRPRPRRRLHARPAMSKVGG